MSGDVVKLKQLLNARPASHQLTVAEQAMLKAIPGLRNRERTRSCQPTVALSIVIASAVALLFGSAALRFRALRTRINFRFKRASFAKLVRRD